ncbi:MAG: hypothetical protein LBJ15_18845 [Comamonas sp.]|jgi:GNAT superfamily N-acetyltransferase|uniref:GNAT family N-acetyltransferase n=1 Tax=Comamonas sp. TaxID=34028 RepID=UPI002833F70C|nr:GNAT family N-acetyltransferase [Comamonas sp.]MDR0216033.1 hypothetical protein [Comamonas sp.]
MTNPAPDASHLRWHLLQVADLQAMHELHLLSIAGMAAQAVKPETRDFMLSLLQGRGRVIGAWHENTLVAYGVLQHDLLAHDDPRSLLGLAAAQPVCKLAGAAVDPGWRGQGLQRELIRRRMDCAPHDAALFATAAPCNLPSWHNLLACGFAVRALQYLYGGHARYLLAMVPQERAALQRPEAEVCVELGNGELPQQQALLMQGWRGMVAGMTAGSLRLVTTVKGG